MDEKKGKVVVIIAPSGAGKSTLISRLKEDFPEIKESISYTTRGIRPGEKDGKNYFFVDNDQFEAMIAQNEFIEWAKVHTNYYGSSKSFVEEMLNSGHVVLFDIDVQGADSIKNVFPNESVHIFIEPPSLEELERRLRGRKTETETAIQERLKNARAELNRKDDFDHLVLNDDLEKSYEELKKIVEKLF